MYTEKAPHVRVAAFKLTRHSQSSLAEFAQVLCINSLYYQFTTILHFRVPSSSNSGSHSHFLALIPFPQSHPSNPHHLKSTEATLQRHAVSLFLPSPLEQSVECPVHPSTSIVEAKDQDRGILPPLNPIFHSGLGVTRGGSQAAEPGD